MARPRVQTRVDPDVEREIEALATREDMSRADTVRKVLRDGLDSQGRDALADGGEIVTRLDEIRAAQVRRERASGFQSTAMAAGLVFVGAALVGVLSDVGVYLGGAAILALLAYAEVARRRADAVELPRDEEVSADV